MAKGQRRKTSSSSNKVDRPAVAIPPSQVSADPPPNRRVRREPPRRQATARTEGLPRRAIAAIAAVIVVAALAVGVYLAFGRSGSSSLATQTLGYPVPDEGRTHVPEGSAINYQHNPPSSGSHYPSPKDWGVYSDPVAPGFFVHNMEHGGVVVLYDCPSGCADIVSQLTDAFKNFPKEKFGEVKLVVSPYHPLPNGAKVAALAWDFEYDFTQGFDENQLLAFYQQHVDHGPEDIP